MFRRSHRHISPEILTEYLDARLAGVRLMRVEQQLAVCPACREELEGLRTTSALLRQLPTMAPRRSFVMAAAPQQVARARPAPLLRMPQWAYAGAASVAALALAVMLSAEATGLLSPSPRAALENGAGMSLAAPDNGDASARMLEADLDAAPTPDADASSLAAENGDIRGSNGAHHQEPAPTTVPTPEPEPISPLGPSGAVQISGLPTPDPEVIGVAVPPADAPPEHVTSVHPEQDQVPLPETIPAPLALTTPEAPDHEETSASVSAPTDTDPQTAARQASNDTITADTALQVSGDGQAEGAPVIWRALQALAATFAVAFLAALALKRRYLRQSPRG